MEVKLHLTKAKPTERYSDILKEYAGLEEGVYASDISPRHKALRSLAFPAGISGGLNALVGGGLAGYIFLFANFALLAFLISRSDVGRRKKQKIPPQPRVLTEGRGAAAEVEDEK